MSARSQTALVLVAVMAAVSLSGCAYLKDRGNDAWDVFDAGVTFTSEPHFAVYVGLVGVLGAGYSDIEDGYMAGIGSRHAGWLHMRYKAAGNVLEAREQIGFDNYDAKDLSTPKDRGIGLGMLYHPVADSFTEFVQCPKFVHIGWIGIDITCKLGELVDFVVGLTTIDIGNDDVHAKKKPSEAPAASPK